MDESSLIQKAMEHGVPGPAHGVFGHPPPVPPRRGKPVHRWYEFTPPREIPENSCECLEWAWVYGEGGEDCNETLGGLDGKSYCRFIKNFKTNTCLHTQFMSQKIDKSVCAVRKGCKGSVDIGNIFNVKYCRKGGKDVRLMDLASHRTDYLGRRHGVDRSVLAGFSRRRLDAHKDDLSKAQIDRIKRSREPTYIWSSANPLADRLEISGSQVWQHHFTADRIYGWDVKCIEGCPPPKPSPKQLAASRAAREAAHRQARPPHTGAPARAQGPGQARKA